MQGPQYIRLTAVRIMQPVQKGGRTELSHTVLKPPVVRLVPLPALLGQNQQDGRTEQDLGGMVVSYQELFSDVAQAIEDAAQAGRCIAIPMNATKLSEAVKAALPKFPMPMNAGSMMDAIRDSTGITDAAGAARTSRMEVAAQAADEIAQKWDDFVQTDGENTGAPAVKVGDVCIMLNQAQDAGVFLVFVAEKSDVEGYAYCWSRDAVPQELRGHYASEDEARQAVRIAGYGRRLVGGE